jgi:hypothetical protein
MLREEDNLPDVISVMRHLPVDRLNNRMFLAANQDLLIKVVRAQRLERIEETPLTSFPISAYVILRSLRLNHKLHVAIAVQLFAISG